MVGEQIPVHVLVRGEGDELEQAIMDERLMQEDCVVIRMPTLEC